MEPTRTDTPPYQSDPEIHALQEQADASFIPWGPGAADVPACALVETFGAYEAEYAAIRKGVGIFTTPHKGIIEVSGAERSDFLHRMITNDVKALAPGEARRAFLLSTRGRIVADLILLQEQERTLIELDRFAAGEVVRTLENYIFSEDVTLRDVSEAWITLSLHGPAGAKLIEMVMGAKVDELGLMCHERLKFGGSQGIVYRRDETGSPGLHLLLPRAQAAEVYKKLAEAVGGLVPDVEPDDAGHGGPKRAIIGRGIGWLAYNTARIEAQAAFFRIDFGTDTLPHETGRRTLDEAVSFTKGCYLGQEIVARMQSLGHPKKVLCALKFEDDRMPIAGVPALDPDTGGEIGAVTSSTISPMLGGKAAALAMLKWGWHLAGKRVAVPAEGARVEGVVAEGGFGLGRG